MRLSPKEIQTAATDLLKAQENGQQIGLLSERHPQITLDDAYVIQRTQMEHRLRQGRRIIGWKIGLTSKVMQDSLGIDTPDSGVLYDNMWFPAGSVIPPGRFIQPRIETEIAFIMRKSLSGAPSREAVLEATAAVAPAIEILDTRILRNDPTTHQPRRIYDTIADNAANAGIVIGDARHIPEDTDLRWVGAIVKKNGQVVATGLGAAVLDDPVTAVQWLAQRMESYGQHIEAGHIILSGSFISPIECPSGTHIVADFGAFGSINVSFA